jgi:hypothetical protein
MRVLPGVPLSELPKVLNQYDVSVIILSDVTNGHLNALPNKLFESIQAKLAIVTGPNPSMSNVVEGSEVGIALRSWSPKELATQLGRLSAREIQLFKENAVVASKEFSTEASKKIFMKILRDLKN